MSLKLEKIHEPVESFEYNISSSSFKAEDSIDYDFQGSRSNKQNSGGAFIDENSELQCLPGFRFRPHDYELILHYLQKKVRNQVLPHNLIREIELYKFNPDDFTKTDQGLGEREWYFFTPRDRKYKNGKRPNRAAGDGYWKATGADKNIRYRGVVVGHRKALVFCQGKAPKGEKTNWIMHEYRVKENEGSRIRTSEHDMRLDDWVLCRIYKKDDKYRRFMKQNGADDDADFQPNETETQVSAPSNITHFPTPTNSSHLPVSSNFCPSINKIRMPSETNGDYRHYCNSLCFPFTNDPSFTNSFAVNNPQLFAPASFPYEHNTNSDTSLFLHNHSFDTNSFDVHNPKPLAYCYASSSFSHDHNNNSIENDDWSSMTEDMLFDNPSVHNLDSIFSDGSQTNNSQMIIPSNVSNSPSSFDDEDQPTTPTPTPR